MKVLVAGRMIVEIDKAGEGGWGVWATEAGVAKDAGLGAGEPLSETVRQQTADGVATACQDECLVEYQFEVSYMQQDLEHTRYFRESRFSSSTDRLSLAPLYCL